MIHRTQRGRDERSPSPPEQRAQEQVTMRHLAAVLRALTLNATLAALAAGCAAGPETGPQETEGKDFFGRSGARSDALRCPTVVGFFGRAGLFVDTLGLICQSGTSVWNTTEVGSPAGDSFSHRCLPGFVGVGFSGSSGKHIVSMQLVCISSTGSRYITEEEGGSTGSSVAFQCADDEKLIGFNVQSVPYINGLEPVCGPL